MAKGLGAIMAEVEMSAAEARLRAGESIACPLCGHEMSNEGGVWFCRSRPKEFVPAHSVGRPCIDDGRVYARYAESFEGFGANEEWQCQMVAAILGEDGRPVVECRVVRGVCGVSNLKVGRSSWHSEIKDDDVPAIVKAGEWVYQDWAVPDPA